MSIEQHADGALRVWWIPQVPGKPFHVPVDSIKEAAKIMDVLAQYDLFQLEHRIKPDFCNAGGLEVYDREEGWSDWYDDFGYDVREWVAMQEANHASKV